MYGYIYETVNKVNGKKYIGQHHSSVFEPSYLGSGKVIRQAIEKYGRDNFLVNVIEECESLQELNDREAFWIEKLDAINSREYYNLVEGGKQYNPMKGRHHTPEAIEKCRQANLGRKFSKERCEKMKETFSGKGNPRYGAVVSEEQKAKQLKSLMKTLKEHPEIAEEHSRFMKEFYKDKTNHPLYGKKHSEETKERIRQKAIGRKASEKTKQKMSQAQKGKPKKSLRKPIMCIETGKVFESSEEVCNFLGLTQKSKQCIARCARNYQEGIKDSSFGYHWKYV